MKTIDLVLKAEWYDMIASGEKREEYREIKPYWCRKIMTQRGFKCPNKFSYGFSQSSSLNLCASARVLPAYNPIQAVLRMYVSVVVIPPKQ